MLGWDAYHVTTASIFITGFRSALITRIAPGHIGPLIAVASVGFRSALITFSLPWPLLFWQFLLPISSLPLRIWLCFRPLGAGVRWFISWRFLPCIASLLRRCWFYFPVEGDVSFITAAVVSPSGWFASASITAAIVSLIGCSGFRSLWGLVGLLAGCGLCAGLLAGCRRGGLLRGGPLRGLITAAEIVLVCILL